MFSFIFCFLYCLEVEIVIVIEIRECYHTVSFYFSLSVRQFSNSVNYTLHWTKVNIKIVIPSDVISILCGITINATIFLFVPVCIIFSTASRILTVLSSFNKFQCWLSKFIRIFNFFIEVYHVFYFLIHLYYTYNSVVFYDSQRII